MRAISAHLYELQVNPTTIDCVGVFGGVFSAFLLGDQNDTFSFAGGTFPLNSNGQALSIRGEAGSDNISGTPYRDLLVGFGLFGDGDGDDVLSGGDGGDAINGGPGDDTILGEGGDDRPTGAGGSRGAREMTSSTEAPAVTTSRRTSTEAAAAAPTR